jgi:hypothetical protein
MISIDDFCKSFGTDKNSFSKECLSSIEETDFSYKILEHEDRDNIILEILKKIESDQQRIGEPKRKTIWNNGWQENLDKFVGSGYDLESLIPKFIRDDQVIRLNGNYVKPNNPRFEYDYMTIFRKWLIERYFPPFQNVYEFGCGTGLNLVLLSETYPEKDLYGSDFVPASVQLVSEIGTKKNKRIKARKFDMIHPDYDFRIEPNSIVFTFGAIEQLSSKFEDFIQYLLHFKPALCIHVEPTIELYDPNTLFDYLAMKFHRNRGYTEGLLTKIRELEEQGLAQLEKVKRLNFGSLFMEGYMYFVWKPT